MKNRIYANKEIKEMVSDYNFPEEFIIFMSNTTKLVKDVVYSNIADSEIRHSIQNKVNNFSNTQADIISNQSKIISESGEAEEVELEDKAKVEDKVTEDVNPYADIEFSKRIYIDKLFLCISDNEECLVHGKLQKTQVACKIDNIRRIGLHLYTCNECKKIFATKEWIEKNEQKLIKNNIDYRIWRTEDEKDNL